jgi:phage terminase large subunit
MTPMSSALVRIGARIRSWRENILAFVPDQFGVEPDLWQREALEAFASADPNKRRISLKASAGPGKSAVLVWCGLWFLATQGERGEHPKGAAVSITLDNLKNNLWPELAKWHARSPYLSAAFTVTSSRIFANDHPETWFLAARSWPKSANADEQGKTLSGLHSKYVFALIDESGAIPTTVLRAAE